MDVTAQQMKFSIKDFFSKCDKSSPNAFEIFFKPFDVIETW